MIVFPNCKINIGLHVLEKRSDSYHNIETIFHPLPLKDCVEIIENPSSTDVLFSTSGIATPTDAAGNLCVQAYSLLKKDFPLLPGLCMHLHKVIPVGAGLGGGSADAAFVLQLINNNYLLGLDKSQLKKYALKLGSDCPFFILNKSCYGTGRGEILEEIVLDLSAYRILLVNPGIKVSTAHAFSILEPASPQINLKQEILSSVSTWPGKIKNDFEPSLFKMYPEVKCIRDLLYQKNALYASLSGSGSTVYGIFEKEMSIDFNFPAHYFYKWV